MKIKIEIDGKTIIRESKFEVGNLVIAHSTTVTYNPYKILNIYAELDCNYKAVWFRYFVKPLHYHEGVEGCHTFDEQVLGRAILYNDYYIQEKEIK